MTQRRIILTGDILRPHPDDPQRSESARRICWFEDLLSLPLTLATGLPVSRLAAEGPTDVPVLYADAGLSPSTDAWASLFAGELPVLLQERILTACHDAIVISVELPPSVAELLRRHDVPVIDCVVDPLRFLTDIPLSWRASHDGVRAALEPFRLAAVEVQRRAAQVRAKTRWLNPVRVPDGATLLLDQTPHDAAMIDPVRKRRVSLADYEEEVAALRAEGSLVWRPHPHNADAPVARELLGGVPQVTSNFYRLVASDQVRRVMAISSGGVVEARAFGKEGRHLLDRSAGIAFPGWATPVPVVGHWLSPHFWSAVLAPLVPTSPDVPVWPPEKDFVRRSINCDWGFGDMDRVVL